MPEAEEGINYGMACFTYKGKPFLSFVTRKKIPGLYPFSGKVIDTLHDQLGGFSLTSGTIRFGAVEPIPEALLKMIIATRLKEIDLRVRDS